MVQVREFGVPVYCKENLLDVTNGTNPGVLLPKEQPGRR
jgi:hypothetical protein